MQLDDGASLQSAHEQVYEVVALLPCLPGAAVQHLLQPLTAKMHGMAHQVCMAPFTAFVSPHLPPFWTPPPPKATPPSRPALESKAGHRVV